MVESPESAERTIMHSLGSIEGVDNNYGREWSYKGRNSKNRVGEMAEVVARI